MINEITKTDLIKLMKSNLKKFDSYKSFVDELFLFGLSKHCCMILDLLVLGRKFETIKTTLLFTEETFDCLILELYETLISFNNKHSRIFKWKKKGN